MKKVLLLLMMVFFLGVNGARAQEGTFSRVGQEDISYEELLSGPKKVLFFWASWCYYCRKELEKLPRFEKELSEKGIELIAINVGEGFSNVQKYTAQVSFPFSVALDKDLTLAKTYNVVGIPTFVYFTGGKEVASEHVFSVGLSEKIFKRFAKKEVAQEEVIVEEKGKEEAEGFAETK